MSEKCSFCKSAIPKGTGKLYISKVGKMSWFCGSKCEKSALKWNKNPAKFKWSSKEKVKKSSK